MLSKDEGALEQKKVGEYQEGASDLVRKTQTTNCPTKPICANTEEKEEHSRPHHTPCWPPTQHAFLPSERLKLVQAGNAPDINMVPCSLLCSQEGTVWANETRTVV